MALTIPTIFTAVDKFSAPVKGMTQSLDSFASRAEIGVSRAERSFRKMTPAISEASKQILSMVGTAALIGAAFSAASFSVKSIMDYETELANLKSITGVSGSEFDVFKTKIKGVADATKMSSVEVTKAFTAIANNQPELLKDANALAMVTQSSILLAQASKMELQPAGEALTQILNQFGKGAADAAKTIDILAAGSVAGSSEIRDTADAIQKFGTVAANAGIKINESVALIELSSKFEKGAEAGQKLRNILITMSTAKVQDPKAIADMQRLGVNMDIVSNRTLPLSVRLKEMGKVAKDDGALFHIFGKENQALATGVLNTASNFDTMLNSVNTTGMAAKMAATNNATLAITIEQLKNKFVTWLTTSDEAAKSLEILKNVVKFLANNLTTIIKVIGLMVGSFIIWWTWIKLSRLALMALNGYAKVMFLVDMIKYIASTQGLTFAQAAWAIVVESATASMAGLNAVMLANPIGLIIIAIVALIALVVAVIKYWNEWGAALSIFLGPFGMIISLVQSFRRNWDMIVESFKSGGIIGGIKAIGKTILDAILMPFQQLMGIIAKLTGFNWAADAAKNLGKFRADMGVNVTTDESGNPLPTNTAINPKTVQAEHLASTINNNKSEKVTFDFVNLPAGVKVSSDSDNSSVMPSMSSTMQY